MESRRLGSCRVTTVAPVFARTTETRFRISISSSITRNRRVGLARAASSPHRVGSIDSSAGKSGSSCSALKSSVLANGSKKRIEDAIADLRRYAAAIILHCDSRATIPNVALQSDFTLLAGFADGLLCIE